MTHFLACGILSHKNCRYYTTIACVKTSFDEERDDGIEHDSEKVRLIQEKLVALQREVDIELKIQEGLEKIVKAKKVERSSKKSSVEKDILVQLDKNNKRLDILKHEMQKRKVQLQTAQISIDRGGSLKKGLVYGIEKKTTSSNNADVIDTGILRVVYVDPVTRAEFKKVVYITENQSTVEVIEMILNKANLLGSPNEYNLLYRPTDGGKHTDDNFRIPNSFER